MKHREEMRDLVRLVEPLKQVNAYPIYDENSTPRGGIKLTGIGLEVGPRDEGITSSSILFRAGPCGDPGHKSERRLPLRFIFRLASVALTDGYTVNIID